MDSDNDEQASVTTFHEDEDPTTRTAAPPTRMAPASATVNVSATTPPRKSPLPTSTTSRRRSPLTTPAPPPAPSAEAPTSSPVARTQPGHPPQQPQQQQQRRSGSSAAAATAATAATAAATAATATTTTPPITTPGPPPTTTRAPDSSVPGLGGVFGSAAQLLQEHEAEEASRPLLRRVATSLSDGVMAARVVLADACDATAWEVLVVALTVVFIALTVAEVSNPWGSLGTPAALLGLSVTSCVLLACFVVETLVKTAAYLGAFWGVPRNALDSVVVLAAFALEAAACALLYASGGVFPTAWAAGAGVPPVVGVSVASRVLRLLVCVTRQRRVRELWTALRTDALRGKESLSPLERTLGILRDVQAR